MTLRVDVQYAVGAERLPKPADFQAWADAAMVDRTEAELVVRVVDRDESARLNQTYRGKSDPTNVLSFPFDPPPQIESRLLGDLVICAPVVADEARIQAKDLRSHWAHMLIHGILHLRGYEHETEQDAVEMETCEISIMTALGFANPYK